MGRCEHGAGDEGEHAREPPAASPEAVLVAGIVAADGRCAENLDDVALAQSQQRLTISTVWERVGVNRPAGRPVGDSFGLTSWSDPGVIATSAHPRLQTAWHTMLAPADASESQYLRLRVDTIDDAERLQALGAVGGRRVVGVVRSHCNDFRWRWPLRVGIVHGPHADEWRSALSRTWFHRDLYEVALIDPAVLDQRFEIVLVGADHLPKDSRLEATLHFAGAVIAVGADHPATVLQRLIDEYRPNTAIAIPTADVSWWGAFVSELAHDCPIDAAAVAAHAGALVAGDQEVLDLTAVGHWAIAADEQAGGTELSADIEHLQFRHEHQGALEVSRRSRQLAAGGATREVRRDNTPKAAALPPDRIGAEPVVSLYPAPMPPQAEASPEPSPPTEPARERRLIAECWVGEDRCRKVLPPATHVLLELKIAVPGTGEVAADAPFPTPSAPGPTAILDVSVRSNLWKGDRRQQISLSLARPDQPSSSAAFEFTTGGPGSVAEFEIVVFHQNRPLQAATLNVAVRQVALPREQITLRVHPLSTPAVPAPAARAVDVALDGRGAELRNRATDAAIPLTAVDQMLDSIELLASQTLGRDNAPDQLDDRRATDLLIELARMGSELRTQLTGLGLEAAMEIDILVMPTTRIFPLELVYEGPAPEPGAERCTHHAVTPPPAGTACAHASPRRVCPYAFWGMHRRISRTVQLASRAPGATDRTVAIGDVLWAAARQADNDAPKGQEPTRLLGIAARQWIGTAQTEPVTSWREWRKQVAARHPGLLLLLAHTELSEREPALLIGTKSYLARPDVSSKVVRGQHAPAPIVVLMACASGSGGDAFGSLPGTFTAHGAGAVVATLTKIAGRHGAIAAEEIMRALASPTNVGSTIGEALLAVRRGLIARGVLLGLLLVCHGNSEIKVVR